MTDPVSTGAGGTGEDEPPVAAFLVGQMPDGVPDLRDDLPFVDQPRLVAVEEQPGQQSGLLARLFVLLERGSAACMAPARPRLPARLRPLDDHDRGALQRLRDLAVSDPVDVAPRRESACHARSVTFPAGKM